MASGETPCEAGLCRVDYYARLKPETTSSLMKFCREVITKNMIEGSNIEDAHCPFMPTPKDAQPTAELFGGLDA